MLYNKLTAILICLIQTFLSVLEIRDILVRIRIQIPVSVPLTSDMLLKD